MLHIGVVGIGDIAKKAYLPILGTMRNVTLHLVTRNPSTLEEVGEAYHTPYRYRHVEEILNLPLDGVFVHAATEAHPSIVSLLLSRGFHTYVDKPLAYTYKEAEEMVLLAQENKRILMVGMNRRFAPMVAELRALKEPRLILMEKNRTLAPGDVRNFLFDDFIHVADTLRFLLQESVRDLKMNFVKEGDLLEQVTLHLIGEKNEAFGVMRRNNGITEEKIEVLSPGVKREIHSLSDGYEYREESDRRLKYGDWVPVLYRRGFVHIIQHFLDSIQGKKEPLPSLEEVLEIHLMLEKMSERIERSRDDGQNKDDPPGQ